MRSHDRLIILTRACDVTNPPPPSREWLLTHCYQPYYCEENVWRLCQQPHFMARPRWAVFIANQHRRCALWHQRAAAAGAVVVWDYHVVMLVTATDGQPLVWDLDCALGAPLPLHTYLAATFLALPAEYAHFRPYFRVVDAATLLQHFSSDRRHMRAADGSYIEPPPRWPPPRGRHAPAHSLGRFIDMSDRFVGEVLNIDQLRQGGVGQCE